MDKKDTKVLERRENKLVAAMARAIAVANGHSHPDEYADAVVQAYLDPETPKTTETDLSETIAGAKADRAKE